MRKRVGLASGIVALCAVTGLSYLTADVAGLVSGPLAFSEQIITPSPVPSLQMPTLPVPALPVATENRELDREILQKIMEQAVSDFGPGFAPEIERDPEANPRIGIAIRDAFTGEILVEHHSDLAQTPASNNKVITTAAALHVLGAESRAQTRVTLADHRLTLVGGGDILLAADYGDPQAVKGHAGLADLADLTVAALRERGIEEVEVAVDTSLFATDTYCPQHSALDQRYVMVTSPIAVERNRQNGAYLPDPAGRARDLFAKHLEKRGITVTARRQAPSPEDAEEIAVVSSAPLRDVLSDMMIPSDNSLAETIALRVTAARGLPADHAHIEQAVKPALAEMGLNVDGLRLADGSGLANGNQVPARLLSEIIAHAASPQPGELASLMTTLPIGGLEGTLRKRQLSFPGAIRAKTGTLVTVVSLSGITRTEDGQNLVFSIVADKLPPGGVWEARLRVDEFAERLARCHCALPSQTQTGQ